MTSCEEATGPGIWGWGLGTGPLGSKLHLPVRAWASVASLCLNGLTQMPPC